MSTEQNRALAHRFFEVVNKGELVALDDLLADEYIQHSIFGLPNGREPVKQAMMGLGAAFPDLKVHVEDVLSEGDRVVARWRMTGTHKGEFQGIPATGKTISVSGIDIWRVKDGKLVEHWDVLDQVGMLQQLGVIPPGGSGAS